MMLEAFDLQFAADALLSFLFLFYEAKKEERLRSKFDFVILLLILLLQKIHYGFVGM